MLHVQYMYLTLPYAFWFAQSQMNQRNDVGILLFLLLNKSSSELYACLVDDNLLVSVSQSPF